MTKVADLSSSVTPQCPSLQSVACAHTKYFLGLVQCTPKYANAHTHILDVIKFCFQGGDVLGGMVLFMRNNNDSSSRKTLNFSIEGDILKNLDTEVQVPTQIRIKTFRT